MYLATAFRTRFFLVWLCEGKVYASIVFDIDVPKTRISYVVLSFPKSMLSKTWIELSFVWMRLELQKFRTLNYMNGLHKLFLCSCFWKNKMVCYWWLELLMILSRKLRYSVIYEESLELLFLISWRKVSIFRSISHQIALLYDSYFIVYWILKCAKPFYDTLN